MIDLLYTFTSLFWIVVTDTHSQPSFWFLHSEYYNSYMLNEIVTVYLQPQPHVSCSAAPDDAKTQGKDESVLHITTVGER